MKIYSENWINWHKSCDSEIFLAILYTMDFHKWSAIIHACDCVFCCLWLSCIHACIYISIYIYFCDALQTSNTTRNYIAFALGAPWDYVCVYNIHLIKCHRMHLQLTPSKFIYLIVCRYSLTLSPILLIHCLSLFWHNSNNNNLPNAKAWECTNSFVTPNQPPPSIHLFNASETLCPML